jgi:hypothetical protein
MIINTVFEPIFMEVEQFIVVKIILQCCYFHCNCSSWSSHWIRRRADITKNAAASIESSTLNARIIS